MAVPLESAVRCLPDGRVLLLPERMPDASDRLHVLRAGVLAGEVKNDRFLPAHALFLAFPQTAFRRNAALSGGALSAFLAGEAVPCDPALSGYVPVCAASFPLGFGKAVSGTLKNHLPKGLRIR